MLAPIWGQNTQLSTNALNKLNHNILYTRLMFDLEDILAAEEAVGLASLDRNTLALIINPIMPTVLTIVQRWYDEIACSFINNLKES
jgi:hypothetical protein